MTTENILIILNLIILESLLSIDNAAVLAVMVKDLPGKQKKLALRYGLFGAYFFRGLCLFLAAWLVKIVILKAIGGAYLIYLAYAHFTPKVTSIEEQKATKERGLYKFFQRLGINRFWSTILLVEVMDLAFSIDNIFAAVALSDSFWVIMAGVAIGILAMRFVAGWFTQLLTKYPTLQTSAFIVIGILGLKLVVSGLTHYVESLQFIETFLEWHAFDLIFSAAMMVIFFIPLLFKKKRQLNPIFE